MNLIILLPFVITIIITVSSACTAYKGSIVILEDKEGTGFTMNFNEWNSKNKCELSLNKGDVLQIEVVSEAGEIALTVIGKNGNEPYTGKKLESGMFTITISESDVYVFRITGKNATGKVIVRNPGSENEDK